MTFLSYFGGTLLTRRKSNQHKQASTLIIPRLLTFFLLAETMLTNTFWHISKSVLKGRVALLQLKEAWNKDTILPAQPKCHAPYAVSYIDISSHHDSVERGHKLKHKCKGLRNLSKVPRSVFELLCLNSWCRLFVSARGPGAREH